MRRQLFSILGLFIILSIWIIGQALVSASSTTATGNASVTRFSLWVDYVRNPGTNSDGVSRNGGTEIEVNSWIYAPNFYSAERLLSVYKGVKTSITQTLETILRTPTAGETIRIADRSGVDAETLN